MGVLDLACGDGFYSRVLSKLGAQKVVGVDISEEMITLARSKLRNETNVEYVCADACEVDLTEKFGKFDVVTACYLLNYSPNAERLEQFLAAIQKHLKPGGHFLGINMDPAKSEKCSDIFMHDVEAIGVNCVFERPLVDGSPIKITFFSKPGDAGFEITNYHLTPETYRKALSGKFTDVVWQDFSVSPNSLEAFPDLLKQSKELPISVFCMQAV